MYHRVAGTGIFDLSLDDWNVSPSRLEKQFQWLARHAECVPLGEVLQKSSCASKSKPVVALTFDDGFANFRHNVLPLLERYRIPATLFVVTRYVGSAEPYPFDHWGQKNRVRVPLVAWRPITWAEIEECLSSGLVSVGSHSHNHFNAINVRDEQLSEEATVSLEMLKRHLGNNAVSFYAYPYGSTRLGQVRTAYTEAIRIAGYTMAVTTDLGLVASCTPCFQVPRVEVHAYDSPRILKAKVFGNLWPQSLCDRFRRAQRHSEPERLTSVAICSAVPEIIPRISGLPAQAIPADLAPRVSVIVACRNEASHIGACLAGLLALEAPAGGFEVVVADGMSDDGTRDILSRIATEVGGQWSVVSSPIASAQSPSPLRTGRGEGQGEVSPIPAVSPYTVLRPLPSPVLRILDNPGRLTSHGLNAAILAARGDIIVRADAHTEYAPDYLLRCLEVLQETGADNVGGPARTKTEGYLQQAIAAAYHSPFSVGGARFHDTEFEGPVDTVTYGCWPRSTFEKFDLFDEELVRNQDDEHNLRITRGGGKIYQSPRIRSWYRPRDSLSALFKQYMQYGYWKVRVIQKHKLPASWRHLVPGTFLLILLLLSLSSVLCPLISILWPSRPPSSVSGPELPWSVVSGQWSVVSLLASLSAYALALITASLITAAKAGWNLLPVLPLVFGCYHFGYGLGFLRGVLDFVILRRGASASFTKLTRPVGTTGPRDNGPRATDH
jgi:peptidoglycan/xylan/chitin deacetylase (PgdA/CDA1 family)/glycosyltransferase involved in cell wall biosynthesis